MCKRNVLIIFLLIFSLSFVAAIGTKEEVSEGPWTPSETIKIIVPWSAGGGTDTLGRALAKHGKEYFGVPVVVENIEGAMGGIGAQRVKNSKPEGYALLLMSGFVSWIGLVQDYPVDVEDFTPIMNLNRDPAAFAVSVDSDIYTLEDLQKYCLAHPGEFSVAHSGDGGTWHIAGVTLADSLGVDMNFVPFNGTAPGVAAVMGNKIQGVSGGAAEFVSQALGNQLRVLAVLSEDRLGPLPDVKTAKDINNQRLSFLFPKYEWLSLGYTISGRDWTTFRNLLTVKIKRKYILLMYSRNDNHRDIEGKISYEKRISKHVILKPLIVYRQYDKKMFWQSKIQLEINFN